MRFRQIPGGWTWILNVSMLVLSAVVAVLVACPAATASAAPAASSAAWTTEGRSASGVYLVEPAHRPGELWNDLPPPRSTGARSDTIDFGFYELREGVPYAIRGGLWTWDHGSTDPLEGWTSVDLTTNDRDYWRWMTEALWVAEGNPGPWPQMNATTGIALCGAPELLADTLGWANGVGYGNNWCQRLVSPQLNYDGSGSVGLSFHYFNETEADYDYSKLYLQQGTARTLLNGPGFTGRIGIDEAGNITQQTYARAIAPEEFAGGSVPQAFWIALEFQSDGGRSDQDGSSGWDAFYGAIGVDDVVIDGANLTPPVSQSSDFESGLLGWTAERCPGAGSFLGVAPYSQYVIEDPCSCELTGNVLEWHDDLQQHPGDPNGQNEYAVSPICDRAADIGDPAYLDYNRILGEWDMYALLPQQDGVFYRARWSYYPYENPNIPGLMQWSPPASGSVFYSWDPSGCFPMRDIATDWAVPATAQKVRLILQLASSCNEFGIPPEQCSGESNFSPIFDNVRIRNVRVPNAPPLAFVTGGTFQDGFGSDQIGPLSSSDPGWANITYDTRMGDEVAVSRLGDSMVVHGPVPSSSTNWEAKLWLRVKRVGPGQSGNTTYNSWKNAWIAARGIPFTPPQSLFTWGYMDSIESGGQASKNKFCSQFRDGPSTGGQDLPADLMYSWGPDTGEQDEGNEMVPDLALTPGTKIDYFITSNYICLPTTYFYLPDTSGGYFNEFEILPSMRLSNGQTKFPCLLYVDADNRGSQFVIENALNVVLNGATPGVPIPDPASWDRYDYLDASSNWKASFYREYGGNAGANIPQLVGYRAIMIDTGAFDTGCTLWRDWFGIQNWLTIPWADGNLATQSFLASGSSVSSIVNRLYPQFLHENLGATHLCDNYSNLGCPTGETDNDQNSCVRVNPVAGSVFGSDVIPTDLFGNWCPSKIPYGVLGTTGTGVGNKNYVKVGTGAVTHYAQVVNDRNPYVEKYRTCIQDFSYGQMTARDPSYPNDPNLECPSDSASRVTAALYEIRNALEWTLNLSNLLTLGLCQVPWGENAVDPPEAAGGIFTNRLYPNHPNPFNPRTTVRFCLAAAGHAKLVVYDVGGRRIRTLVDGPQTAGLHEAIWDGTDDAGRPVPSGVYWTRLSTGSFQSNRKMVVLK